MRWPPLCPLSGLNVVFYLKSSREDTSILLEVLHEFLEQTCAVNIKRRTPQNKAFRKLALLSVASGISLCPFFFQEPSLDLSLSESSGSRTNEAAGGFRGVWKQGLGTGGFGNQGMNSTVARLVTSSKKFLLY